MKQEQIIIFDGVCNLCSASVRFIIKRDKGFNFKFVTVQSEPGKVLLEEHGLNPDCIHTMLLVKEGAAYTRSDAALEISRCLDGLWPILVVLKIIPKFIRNGLYTIIANNRYKWFGKKEACLVPTPDIKSRFIE